MMTHDDFKEGVLIKASVDMGRVDNDVGICIKKWRTHFSGSQFIYKIYSLRYDKFYEFDKYNLKFLEIIL